MSALPASMHPTMCILGSQKRALDFLELELLMVVNHLIGARNLTRVLCKISECYNH